MRYIIKEFQIIDIDEMMRKYNNIYIIKNMKDIWLVVYLNY